MEIDIGIGEIVLIAGNVELESSIPISTGGIVLTEKSVSLLVYKVPEWEFEPVGFTERSIKTKSHDPCGYWFEDRGVVENPVWDFVEQGEKL